MGENRRRGEERRTVKFLRRGYGSEPLLNEFRKEFPEIKIFSG